jgi:hypothetical protein
VRGACPPCGECVRKLGDDGNDAAGYYADDGYNGAAKRDCTVEDSDAGRYDTRDA